MQMVSLKHTVALALVAMGRAAASPKYCGNLGQYCCDIPENDPNGGTCKDDTLLACWEGVCKPCGTDGMPACAGPTPCTGENIIHVGTFCTFDNSKAPEPSPKPAPKPSKPPRKRPSKSKGPRVGRRTRMRAPKAPRGTVKPPPPPRKEPSSAAKPAALAKKVKAEPAPQGLQCGDLKWECCDIPDNDPNGGTCKDDTRMACWEGFCKPCGTDGMPICAGPTPCTGKLVVDHNNFCTFDNGTY